MNPLEQLLTMEGSELLSVLPKYQREIISSFLENDADKLAAANKWLSAKPSNTEGFGGVSKNSNIYLDKIIEELEKYICGDEKYTEDRNKLISSTNVPVQFIIGGISTAIGTAIGAAGVYLVPAVVLILMNAGKIGKNGWCEARKAIRNKSNI
jgi:hypothetical protein